MILSIFFAAIIVVGQADSTALARPDSLSQPMPDSQPGLTAPDSLPIYYLKGITVTASRTPMADIVTPASVTVVEPDPLAPAAAASLLARQPGVGLGSYGGPGSLSTLTLRGSASADVLYLLDGVPLNSARDGTYDINHIPSGAVRIEVLRGPAASLYGANAVAGVVNIITEPRYRGRPHSRVRFQQGNFGSRLMEAELSRQVRTWAMFSVAGSWNKTDGQRTNSDYDGSQYSVDLRLSPSDILGIDLRLQHYASENGNPGPLSSPSISDRQRDLEDDLQLRLAYQNWASVKASRSASSRDILSPWGDTRNRTVQKQLEVSVDRSFIPATRTVAGLSASEAEDQSTKSGNRIQGQAAVFVTQQVSVVEHVLAIGGLRLDRTAAHPSQLSPSLSVSYNPVPSAAVYASYGRAYRAPSLIDLYWPVEIFPPFYGSNYYKTSGNPDLKPETSHQYEVGVKFDSPALKATLAAYERRTKDLIDWTHTSFLPPDTTFNQPANLGRAKATGLELTASVTPFAWLSLDGNYSYCLAVDDTAGGKQLPYRPLNAANASLRIVDIKIVDRMWIGWKFGARYVDRQVVSHATDWGPGLDLPSCVTADQTFSVKIRDARIYFQVENLFNAEHQTRYGYPMPRRSFAFGIDLELWD